MVLSAVALAAALAGCGEDTSAELGRQQLRLELLALKASLAGVSSLGANATVNDVRVAINQTHAAWETVAGNAAVLVDPQAADVNVAWKDLERAVDRLSGDLLLKDALPRIRDEIDTLKNAYDALYQDLQ